MESFDAGVDVHKNKGYNQKNTVCEKKWFQEKHQRHINFILSQ